MCASRHTSDPGPLGRFAPVADTQGFAPRPLGALSGAVVASGHCFLSLNVPDLSSWWMG